MTKKQKRVFEIIKALKHYINTYESQSGYLDYSDETIINDMLYGIGVAIDEKYKWAKGFDDFKNHLATNFIQQPLSGSPEGSHKSASQTSDTANVVRNRE